MVFVGVVFFIAIIGIIGLFGLKQWEKTRGRVFFSSIRYAADVQAVRMKQFLVAGVRDLEKLPPFLLYLLRVGVHMGAVAFGHLAHWIGERSHALADMVSHKHRFERRPPRSEFLMQVDEHSMKSRPTNGNGSDWMQSIQSFESIPPKEAPYAEPAPIKGAEGNEAKPEDAPRMFKRRKARVKKAGKNENGENGEKAGESV